jgi:hypothetical protein
VTENERCKYDQVIDPSDRYAIRPRRCTRTAVVDGYCKQHLRKVEQRKVWQAEFRASMEDDQ